MTHLRLFITILLCAAAVDVMAGGNDTIILERNNFDNELAKHSLYNPAFMQDAYATQLTEFYGIYDNRSSDEPYLLQEGTRHFSLALRAETYLKLTRHSSVWGSAAYTNGRHKRLRFISTSDFGLLYPLVLADTTGGGTHYEQYSFSGGYAGKVGKLTLGAEMIFRAEQEYRNYDMRMRGVVSDLTLKGGARYAMGNYDAGAAFEGNVYRQDNDVTFFNDAGGIGEYAMMGLGNIFNRFVNTKQSMFFKGGGVKLRLDVMPHGKGGIFGNADLSHYSYEMQNYNNNDYPMATLFVQSAEGRLGYRHNGTLRWAAYFSTAFSKRSNDEHYAGTSNTSFYPELVTLTKYKSYNSRNMLHAMIGQQKRTSWWAELYGGVNDYRSSYADPHRRMDFKSWEIGAKGRVATPIGKNFTLVAAANVNIVRNTSGKLVADDAELDSIMHVMLTYDYNSLTSHLTTLGADIRIDRLPHNSHIGYFLAVRPSAVFCTDHKTRRYINLQIGITF